MGKYSRKRGAGIGEVAVMEVTQLVGVRTRARTLALAAAASAAKVERGKGPKRRKAASVMPPAAEYQISYLQLRSRSVVLRPQRITTRSASSNAFRRRTSAELGRISRCSSNASCEAANSSLPGDPEIVDVLEISNCYDSSRERRETTPLRSTNLGHDSSDSESTAGRKARWRMNDAAEPPPPWEAEIEEFLAASEKEERRRFGEKYNYDFVEDVPLDGGRYEWVRLSP